MAGLHCGNRVRVRKEDIYSGGKFDISVQTFRCMNFWRGSYHKSKTRPDGTAPHRNVLSVYGFLAETERSGLSVCSLFSVNKQTDQSNSALLTYTAPPTTFSVRNLYRYGKLSVANREYPGQNKQTKLGLQYPPSSKSGGSIIHDIINTAAPTAPVSLHLWWRVVPETDPLSEAVGAEWQAAVFLVQMSFLFKQSWQAVRVKLGRLPCRMEPF